MTALPFGRALGAALLLAVAVAGCDFTPTLDVDTPDYAPGLVLRSILVADSVATVRVGESFDPYEGSVSPNRNSREETLDAVVTLLRDGQPVERLMLGADSCEAYGRPPDPETGLPPYYACGPYVGTVRIEAGATYTIRAEAEGLPPVEATVTVPRRPAVEVVEEPAAFEEARRFRIRIADPPGAGDLYGVSLLRSTLTVRSTTCENNVCTDSTYVVRTDGRGQTSYETSDPVILAASREVAGSGVALATFTDETFEGREKAFTITPSPAYTRDDTDGRLTIQVAALSPNAYDLYQIVAFSGGSDNPFVEPINLPSNVEGGYGLVGAAALAEVTFEARTP